VSYDLDDFIKDNRQNLLDVFRIETLGHGRVAAQAGEKNGDVFSFSG
jgi:hypothetical protein